MSHPVSFLEMVLYSKSVREDLRRRFVKAETTLFKIRYEESDTKELMDFLNSRDFNWIPVRHIFCLKPSVLSIFQVDKDEKNLYKKELFAASQGTKSESEKSGAFDRENFYKVAPHLILHFPVD